MVKLLGRPIFTIMAITLAVILTIAFVFIDMNPPKPLGKNIDKNSFSASRALVHIKNTTKHPHSTGTAENAEVRDYIVKTVESMGYKCEVQKSTVLQKTRMDYLSAAVKNIIVRVKGTHNSKAILLCTHYDSVPSSPGASDDASGVATLLETMRTLKESKPIKNDVIFLFTEAEELGLNGAIAFAQEKARINKVGLVLNFEARGNKGQSIMFETSEKNGKLIEEFSRAVDYSTATSLSFEIYKAMNNDTDFSIFKKAGVAGFNFAPIGGQNSYHTVLDNYKNVDKGALQQNGDYALSIIKHFGNMNLSNKTDLKKSNYTYFNLYHGFLVAYPEGWNLLFTIIAILLFVGCMVLGIKKRWLTIKGVAMSFLLFILSGGIIAFITGELWSILSDKLSKYNILLQIDTDMSKYFLIALVFFIMAVFTSVYALLNKRFNLKVCNMIFGIQAFMLIFCILVYFTFPGAQYLILWPLFISLLALIITFALPEAKSDGEENIERLAVIFTVPAVLLMVLMVPAIVLLYMALGLNLASVIAILIVLALSFLIPYFMLLSRQFKWIPQAACLAISIVVMIFGIVNLKYSSNHPMFSTIDYVLNGNSGKASWISGDEKINKWTKQFFSNKDIRHSLTDIYPEYESGLIVSEAKRIEAALPELKVIKNVKNGEFREMTLHLKSLRNANNMYLRLPREVDIKDIIVDGQKPSKLNSDKDGEDTKKKPKRQKIEADGIKYIMNEHWSIDCIAVPKEGIDVLIKFKYNKPFTVQLLDETYGFTALKGINIKKAPSDIITVNDQSVRVSKKYEIVP